MATTTQEPATSTPAPYAHADVHTNWNASNTTVAVVFEVRSACSLALNLSAGVNATWIAGQDAFVAAVTRGIAATLGVDPSQVLVTSALVVEDATTRMRSRKRARALQAAGSSP